MHLTRRNEIMGLLVIAAAAGLGYFYFTYWMVTGPSHNLSATIISVADNEIKTSAVHIIDESSKTTKAKDVTVLIDGNTIFSKKTWSIPDKEGEPIPPPTRKTVGKQEAMQDLQKLVGKTISVQTAEDTLRAQIVTAERVDYTLGIR